MRTKVRAKFQSALVRPTSHSSEPIPHARASLLQKHHSRRPKIATKLNFKLKLPESSVNVNLGKLYSIPYGKSLCCSAILGNGVKVYYFDRTFSSPAVLATQLHRLGHYADTVLKHGSNMLIIRKVAVTDEPESQPLCVMAVPERFLLRHMSKTSHRTRMVFLAQRTGRPDSPYYPVGITEDFFVPNRYRSALQWASYNFKGTLIDRSLQAPQDPRLLLNFLAQMSSAASEPNVPKVKGKNSVEFDEALAKMYTYSSPARYLVLPRRLRSLSTADDCSAMLSDGTPVFFPKFFMGTQSLYALQTEMRVLDAFVSNLQKHRPPSQFIHALIVRTPHHFEGRRRDTHMTVIVHTCKAWYGLEKPEYYHVFSVQQDPRNGYDSHLRIGTVDSTTIFSRPVEAQLVAASAAFKGQLHSDSWIPPKPSQNLHHCLPPFEALRLWFYAGKPMAATNFDQQQQHVDATDLSPSILPWWYISHGKYYFKHASVRIDNKHTVFYLPVKWPSWQRWPELQAQLKVLREFFSELKDQDGKQSPIMAPVRGLYSRFSNASLSENLYLVVCRLSDSSVISTGSIDVWVYNRAAWLGKHESARRTASYRIFGSGGRYSHHKLSHTIRPPHQGPGFSKKIAICLKNFAGSLVANAFVRTGSSLRNSFSIRHRPKIGPRSIWEDKLNENYDETLQQGILSASTDSDSFAGESFFTLEDQELEVYEHDIESPSPSGTNLERNSPNPSKWDKGLVKEDQREITNSNVVGRQKLPQKRPTAVSMEPLSDGQWNEYFAVAARRRRRQPGAKIEK